MRRVTPPLARSTTRSSGSIRGRKAPRGARSKASGTGQHRSRTRPPRQRPPTQPTAAPQSGLQPSAPRTGGLSRARPRECVTTFGSPPEHEFGFREQPPPRPDGLPGRPGSSAATPAERQLRAARNRLVVITGPSGSGKSSLAFRYHLRRGAAPLRQSLSAYARQFLDQLPKPAVESIEGLSPAIAIEQKGSARARARRSARSPRSPTICAALLADRASRTVPNRQGAARLHRAGDRGRDILSRGEARVWRCSHPSCAAEGRSRDRPGAPAREGFVRARVDGSQGRPRDDVTISRTKEP